MKNKLLLLLTVAYSFLACSSVSKIVPVLESKPELIYPLEALENKIEGDVELLLLVNNEGYVINVSLKNSSSSKILDGAAVKYAKKFKYSPIKELDSGGGIWIATAVNFSLEQNGIESSYTGRIWESEMERWIDPEFGQEITKWTSDDYENWPLYFNVESFIEENKIIFYSTRSGGVNLFSLNLSDGRITQLTNQKAKIGLVWHVRALKKIWYEVDNTLRELNYQTLEERKVFSKDRVDIKSFTVTCDGKYLVYSVNKNPGYSADHSTGPFAIMRYNLQSEETKQISPDYGFSINHLQASPADPSIITYAWQHQYREGGTGTVGNTPIRIWWLNINGNDGAPVIPQEYGLHRTHEFWFSDGSRIGYSARFMYGQNQGKQFLGSCKYDGSDNYMFEAPVGPAHSQVFKDNKHWVADQNNGMILTLWTFDRGKILKEKKLFRHNSTWIGQPGHPHPHFSPDGKIVLFGTDRTGSPQVYSVKVDLKETE